MLMICSCKLIPLASRRCRTLLPPSAALPKANMLLEGVATTELPSGLLNDRDAVGVWNVNDAFPASSDTALAFIDAGRAAL